MVLSDLSGLALMGVVISASGVLGGTAAFIRGTSVAAGTVPSPWPLRIAGDILESLVAAAIVPLFLSTIGSDDIKTLLGKLSIYDPAYQLSLVRFVGFCLVAAIGARRFIESASARVFRLESKLRDVQERGVQNESKIGELADVVIEPEVVATKAAVATPASAEANFADLPSAQADVLAAFANSNIPARSTQGLALSLARPESDIRLSLRALRERGLVRATETFRGERWVLTSLGSDALRRTQ